ncbi:hypothetical protein [Streptomyces formicae]|uniref:Transposase n=1 Tax=Streptomyces formicae TaxID=1616117 RepID=A0A291QMI4_9ACTN|nr:hypothetical protein [Streptomyces formicae]ATL32762.1 Transposase [Streptomyces formicae]
MVTTTCEFLRFGVRQEWVPADLGAQLSHEKHLVYLPRGFQAGEDGQFRTIQTSELKFTVSDEGIAWLTPGEVDRAVLGANRARDRFLVGLLWVTGMRIGEALGLRREDMHLLSSSRTLGCPIAGPHVHVRRRINTNGALAKSPVAGRQGDTRDRGGGRPVRRLRP